MIQNNYIHIWYVHFIIFTYDLYSHNIEKYSTKSKLIYCIQQWLYTAVFMASDAVCYWFICGNVYVLPECKKVGILICLSAFYPFLRFSLFYCCKLVISFSLTESQNTPEYICIINYFYTRYALSVLHGWEWEQFVAMATCLPTLFTGPVRIEARLPSVCVFSSPQITHRAPATFV